MKRPLLPVALLFAAGIVAAYLAEVSLAPLFALALACGGAALLWERRRTWALGLCLFFSGWANLGWRAEVVSPRDLRALVGERACLVTLRGRIAGPPSQRVLERADQEFWHALAPLEVSALRVGKGRWEPAVGTVQTSTRGQALTNLFQGQAVEVDGVLSAPPGPLAEGLFDYRTYLRWQGIHQQLSVEAERDWRVVGATNPPPWTEKFRLWAQRTLARGMPVVDEPLRLQWAMVLGWKTALTGEVSEPFMRSGTMHIFAISGLHIALIAGILLALFRLFNLPRGLCGAAVIPLIWFYTAATEWQASAIRSTVMMSVIIAGWSLRRPSDLLNSLAAAAFIILVWDPAQLFQAGFQLSFGAVLSLALLMPPLEDMRLRWLRPDPLVPEDLRPRWQRWVWSGAKRLCQGLATSLAASLGTAPLIAHYFHLFSPVSLLANLLVVPLSGLALMCGLGSVVCGAWLPWATECFNQAGWFFMLGMMKASEWATLLPAAYWYVAPPGILFIVLYYAGLGAWRGGLLSGPHRRLVATGLGALGVVWLGSVWHERSAARLTALPLRGGDAVWLDAPGRAGDWLVDCGDENMAERVTVPFLRGQGVDRVPHFLLTHGDVRHVGGGTNLLTSFKIGALHASPVRFRSPYYREVVAAWTNRPRAVNLLQAGDHVGPWTVVHPRADDRFRVADDATVILRGEFLGTRVLLLSEPAVPGQNALLQRQADLRADIVVAGLPIGAEPLHDALLEAIRPQVIVITDSDRPALARSSEKLRGRLAKRGVPVLYLRETGAVTIEFRRGGWLVRSMEGPEYSGRPSAREPRPDTARAADQSP
jgi:competence protein ComEC